MAMIPSLRIIDLYAYGGFAEGSLKNNFTFYAPMHPVGLRCKNSEYLDIPVFSRLDRRAPQHLKL
jgi:hypothetical protein